MLALWPASNVVVQAATPACHALAIRRRSGPQPLPSDSTSTYSPAAFVLSGPKGTASTVPDDRNVQPVNLLAQLQALTPTPVARTWRLPQASALRLASVATVVAVVIATGLIVDRSDSGPEDPQHAPAEMSVPPEAAERLVKGAPPAIDPDATISTPSQEIGDDVRRDRVELDRRMDKSAMSLARASATPPVLPARPHTPHRVKDVAGTVDARSDRRNTRPQQAAASIEPYRNGTLAKRLTGEALRLALIEDRRLTREINEASLREIRAKLKGD